MVALPGEVAQRHLATPYYDLILARRRTMSMGDIGPRSQVAIFLIYPKNGLERSHLATLRYFDRKGFAPLVVSNLPLSSEDRSAVLKTSWRLIERPNFGYDFGGYRDGILSLGEEIRQLNRLVLVNDSCWFPLPGAADWLDQAQALKVDFAGAASNYGIAPPSENHHISWRYDTSLADFHYCSFALAFSRALLSHEAFLSYWRRLQLTNDKFEVVRRGEVALSQLVIGLGFSHGATLDISGLDRDFDQLDAGGVRTVLQNLVIPEDHKLRRAKHDVLLRFDGSPAWRQEAIHFLLCAVALTGVSYALPAYAVGTMKFPFLKKSPLWLDSEGAETTIRVLETLGPEGEDLLAEAKALSRSAARAD